MGSHVSPPPPPEAALVFDALRRLVRFLRLSSATSAAGPSSAQYFVLAQLDGAPASSIRELAARTMTDPSSVSVIVQKLEAQGLVRRDPHPADKRRSTLTLTAKGKRALARAPELPQLRIVAALALMPRARRQAIARALRDLVVSIGADTVSPTLFFEDEPERGGARRAKR